jgi:uncharacterized membrane protein YkoI
VVGQVRADAGQHVDLRIDAATGKVLEFAK